MKRTIYDCWRCRHHNSDNPYGIDYCEVHDTRCSFAHDDCDDFEPVNDCNERHPQPPRRLTVIIWYLELIAVAAILGWLLMGCTTTRYVPVEHHTTDTVYQSKLQRDSIWLHDSIHVTERGDTIRIERWHTKYIEREVHDTLYRAKTDSIPVPYEVVKEVPRKKSKFEIVVFTIGIIAIMGLIIFIGMKLKKFLP